jgi:hypothetical protein
MWLRIGGMESGAPDRSKAASAGARPTVIGLQK